MTSFFRRAGAGISRYIRLDSDPSQEGNRMLVYSKLDGEGASQLFARSDDGTVYQLTPPAGGSSVADIAKYAVRVATDTGLPPSSFLAGTLTANNVGSLNAVGIDGVTTLAPGDRVLVKNEPVGKKNLIYTIDDVGSDAVGPATPACPAPTTFSGALITCGSGGDHATLSAAVAAATPGDRIQILPGTIVEASAVAVNKSLEIFGAGATSIIQRNSLTEVINVTVGNVYLHDFKVVNNQTPIADPSGLSCCVRADTMSRTSYGGVTGLYFANLTCTFPKVGIFVSGTDWVIRDCAFVSNVAVASTTIRAVFAYGSEGTSFICGNTYDGPNDNTRLTAIYLNTRNDGIAPNYETGYKGSLVIDSNVITPGKGAPRSYIDATSIYHQSGPAATFPPYGEFSLYLVSNDFSVDHNSSPCVFFGRFYGVTPVLPLSFFLDLVVSNNKFGKRLSGNQKGALFWTNTSGSAQNMGSLVNLWGAGNTISAAALPVGNTSIMADLSLLMVREDAFYNAPAPLLTLLPTVAGTPWSMTWASDFDTDPEVTRGVFTAVNEGTKNQRTDWIVVTPDPIVVGTTGLTWELFGKKLIVGDGLTIVNPVKQIAFAGSGATVTNGGDGLATVTISSASNPTLIWAGGRNTYELDTPPLVVGAFAFDKTEWTYSTIKFRAVAAKGDSVNAIVELWNLTDSVLLSTLTFSSTASALAESADLAASIPAASKIYEARVYLAAAPGANDSVELYSAALEIK